jgi:integrase/recombinase XerD
VIERVLASPPKRYDRRLVTFLTEPELEALLGAPPRSSWTGRRDHTLLALATQTGLRASELTGLRCNDVHLGTGAHVSCMGKGRKLRITPLTSGMVAVLRAWLAERTGQPADPLFPTQSGTALSRDAVEHRLAKYVQIAVGACQSLKQKKVTMHVLRHTAAMRLLRAGIETSMIALWLGHEQIETTHIYLHADLEIKERALATTAPANATPGRFRPNDKLLAFLEAL